MKKVRGRSRRASCREGGTLGPDPPTVERESERERERERVDNTCSIVKF